MEKEKQSLSRRDFLRVSGASITGFVLSPYLDKLDQPKESDPETNWPSLRTAELPVGEIKEVLQIIPEITIDEEGYLTSNGGRLPLAETEWSTSNRRPIEPDAITIHWNGSINPMNTMVMGVLSGYDQERTSRDGSFTYTTSAHITIGPYRIEDRGEIPNPTDSISVLQTQRPEGGYPTVASHLRGNLHTERQLYTQAQHPINAMRSLIDVYGLSEDYNYLFGALGGSVNEDLNLRAVALELLGYNFDNEGSHPNPQEIANCVATIFAYMERYPDISFANITGHFEIQMDKADPGKKFMAELRLILALKVLEGTNETLKENFFAPFMTESGDKKEAVKRFFDFHWDYMVNSYWGRPMQVHDWEKKTNFWNIYQNLFPETSIPVADSFSLPVAPEGDRNIVIGSTFTVPEFHEGIDFNLQATRRIINEDFGARVSATANGKVVFAGEIPGNPGLGNTIVVEHIVDGAKVMSLYAHLNDILVEKGNIVRKGGRIATMGNSGGQPDSHLHFALFPAATKRQKELMHYLQLKYQGEAINPYLEIESGRIYVVPGTANANEIHTYYFSPIPFIERYPFEESLNPNMTTNLPRRIIERINE